MKYRFLLISLLLVPAGAQAQTTSALPGASTRSALGLEFNRSTRECEKAAPNPNNL